jgi:phage shock protein C
MNRRLFRLRSNRMIAGVCGGLGEYLGIDPTFVRIFFVLLALSNGLGVLVYLLMWIIIPPEDKARISLPDAARTGADEIAEQARSMGVDLRHAVRSPNSQTWMYIGVGLILLGLFALLDKLPWAWLRWLNWNFFWPVLLVLAGVALIVRYFRNE